jgi:translation initiation factor 4E
LIEIFHYFNFYLGLCLMINYIIFFCCSLYEQVFKPSKLPGNADFHLFKDGIEPKWEDPVCASGGKWSVTSSRKADLDTMWLETVIILPLTL